MRNGDAPLRILVERELEAIEAGKRAYLKRTNSTVPGQQPSNSCGAGEGSMENSKRSLSDEQSWHFYLCIQLRTRKGELQ